MQSMLQEKKSKYQQQIDTWYDEIYKMDISPEYKQYSFSNIRYMGVISNNKTGKGYHDFKSILKNTII